MSEVDSHGLESGIYCPYLLKSCVLGQGGLTLALDMLPYSSEYTVFLTEYSLSFLLMLPEFSFLGNLGPTLKILCVSQL